MVEVQIAYEGQLRCSAKHMPSGTVIKTDAPVDNMGKGESFSPTDLVATALGTCILTTIAIVAKRRNIELADGAVRVTKEMTTEGPRRIARLATDITIKQQLGEEDRQRFEHAAHACPVHKSLHPDVDAPITFHWP